MNTNVKSPLLFPIMLVIYEMAVYLSNDMYLPALPSIAQQFHASHVLVQMTLASWFFGAVSMQLILGPISDRYGRRPVLLWGGVLFILSTLACALSPNIIMLLVARFIQGMAVCSIATSGYACINELYDRKQAISILAMMGGIGVLAPAFGPLLGGIILQFYSWRFSFALLIPWALLPLLILYKVMPETATNREEHPIQVRPLLKTYRAIISDYDFSFYTAIFGTMFCGMIAWIVAGPFLVISVFHYNTVTYGLLQALVFGAFIIGSKGVKRLMSVISIHKMIAVGSVLTLISGLLAFVLTSLIPHNIFVLVVSLMLYSIGASFLFGSLQRLAVESPKEPMGSIMAVFSTSRCVFAILATLLVSAFYNGTTHSLAEIIFSSAAISSAIFIVSIWRKRE